MALLKYFDNVMSNLEHTFLKKSRMKSSLIAFPGQNDALHKNSNMIELGKLRVRIQRAKIHEKWNFRNI